MKAAQHLSFEGSSNRLNEDDKENINHQNNNVVAQERNNRLNSTVLRDITVEIKVIHALE